MKCLTHPLKQVIQRGRHSPKIPGNVQRRHKESFQRWKVWSHCLLKGRHVWILLQAHSEKDDRPLHGQWNRSGIQGVWVRKGYPSYWNIQEGISRRFFPPHVCPEEDSITVTRSREISISCTATSTVESPKQDPQVRVRRCGLNPHQPIHHMLSTSP